MKYPEDFLNKIICGDCLEVMSKIPDKSVDLVFYDPPYNAKKKYDGYSDNLSQTKYMAWMYQVTRESIRISRRGICIYVSGKLSTTFARVTPEETKLIIIHKRAAGAVSNNYMMQYHSLFSTATPIVKCKDLWDDIRLPGEGYFFREPRYDNPGMTSVSLVERVLHHFTLEGDIVLDPFMGTGATAHACKNMNRNYIGIDQSEKYCEVVRSRVDE